MGYRAKRVLTTDDLNNIKTINNESLVGSGNIEISGGEPPITIVDSLPPANEENYLLGKIYTQGDLLQYISKVALEEPNLSTVANLVSAAYGLGAAAVGTNIYIFGGYNGSKAFNTISKFDTTTNTLTTLSATLPNAVYGLGAAAVGNDIYLFGGADGPSGNKFDTINKFDTNTETITTLSTTLPTKIRTTSAVSVGSNIYLFGNYFSGITNTIYKFNTTTNTITTLGATLPTGALSIGTASVGSNIYLFGGQGSSRLSTINKFDTNSETITTLSTTIPTAAYGIRAAAVGNDIYLFGGNISGNSLLNTINKFDTTTETIETLSTTLPTGALSIGTVSVGSNIYLFGGKGSSALNTINKVELGYLYSYKDFPADIDNKQDTLVSGTNIKTINNTSLLGSGNITISSGTEVVANNGETTSATLNTLKVGNTNYSVPQGGGGTGGADIIYIDVEVGDLSQYTTNIISKRLVVGTNITQEDYNKLVVEGVHAISLDIGYEKNGSHETNAYELVGVTQVLDDGVYLFVTSKCLISYFNDVFIDDDTEGKLMWISEVGVLIQHFDNMTQANQSIVMVRGYKVKTV